MVKVIELKPFKNKRTGQLSVVIPKKKIKLLGKKDYIFVKIKVKGVKKW